MSATIHQNVTFINDTVDVVVKALQKNAGIFVAGMEPWVLQDTGATRASARVEDTLIGFNVLYGTDYSQYIYHNPRIQNVTTPGTSSYWDDKYTMSDSYDYFLSAVDADIERMLNNV